MAEINALEPTVKALTDEQMRERISQIREQVIKDIGDTRVKDDAGREARKRRTREALDAVLPEVFPLTREAAVRSRDAPSTCSSSAASPSTRVASPR